jgi:hypothetical protein
MIQLINDSLIRIQFSIPPTPRLLGTSAGGLKDMKTPNSEKNYFG